jgi:hypothetical protein
MLTPVIPSILFGAAQFASTKGAFFKIVQHGGFKLPTAKRVAYQLVLQPIGEGATEVTIASGDSTSQPTVSFKATIKGITAITIPAAATGDFLVITTTRPIALVELATVSINPAMQEGQATPLVISPESTFSLKRLSGSFVGEAGAESKCQVTFPLGYFLLRLSCNGELEIATKDGIVRLTGYCTMMVDNASTLILTAVTKTNVSLGWVEYTKLQVALADGTQIWNV